MTSTSILVRRKQSSASSGRSTIGSFSLNDVLRSTGTPVSSPNRWMSVQYGRLSARSTVCSRPDSVDVRHGRNDRPAVRTDRDDLDHERIGHGVDEVVVDRFDDRRRRERRNFSRNLILVLMMSRMSARPRIGEDAAVAERPRAPLHAALKPADDVSRREVGCRPVAQHREVRRSSCDPQRSAAQFVGARVDRGRDRAVVERRPPVAVRHHEPPRLARQLVPDVECGARARCRLSEEAG